MERRADLAEGRADALSLGGPARTLADEFAELSADDSVSIELEAMKARLQPKTEG
jgi:phage shock protein A